MAVMGGKIWVVLEGFPLYWENIFKEDKNEK